MRIPGVPYVQGRNDYPDADGTKYGIAIHNTSNDATAEGEASYATRRTDGISAHLYVDRDSVVQSLDTADRAGHAGSSNGNQHAIAVEITGVNGKTRQWWLDNVAWAKLGAALAHVVRKYGIAVRRASAAEMKTNPKVRAFYSHDDMRRAWGGTTHTDPGGNFPWDRLFQAVNAALAGDTEDDMPLTKADEPIIQHAVHGMMIGKSGVWAGAVLDDMRMVPDKLDAILKAVLGDADADRIVAELHAQGEQTRAALTGVRDAILAELPDEGPVSREDLVAALTTVLGSVDNVPPS